MNTATKKPTSEIVTFPPDLVREPAEIIPFPRRPRRRKSGPVDEFESKLEGWKSSFEYCAQTQEEIRLELRIPAMLFGALITEAAVSRLNMFHLAKHFIELGLDRFDAEGLRWTHLPPDLPENLIPLRFFRDVVKQNDD